MKLKAYKRTPELAESGWDMFTLDDGRAWGIVANGHGAYSYLDAPSDMVEAAWEAAEEIPYDRRGLAAFLEIDFGRVYAAVAEFVRVTGVNWRQPTVRAARKAAHEAVKLNLAGVHDRVQTTAALLTCASGTTWAAREISGNCQGDWATLIYPVYDLSADGVEEIEARYFNTGDECLIEDGNGDVVASCYTWQTDDEAQLREYVRDCVDADAELEIYDIDGYMPARLIYRKRGGVAA